MNPVIEAAYERFQVKRFPLPTEEQVVALERRLKIPLPGHYRQFILEFNGGCFPEPSPFITPLHEECPWDCLNVLWGIGASYTFAELAHDVDLFDGNDPPIILPIGNTDMGNLLYLTTQDAPDYGSVCLKLAFSWTCFVIADTMEEFFGLLRREPPDHFRDTSES